MYRISTKNKNSKEIDEEIKKEIRNNSPKNKRKYSSNSSSDSESFCANLKEEIKNLIENDNNLSFSSNSEQEELPVKQEKEEYLLDPKFWRSEKNYAYDNEYNQYKKILKNGIKEESNKQSTQGNEDEEIRNDQIHNNSLSESNNSPINIIVNNEINENEANNDKIIVKENKNYIINSPQNKGQKNKIENKNNINNKDKNNLNGTNILLKDSNFANNNNYKATNTYTKFIFPYEPINYITNQTGSNFFPGTFFANNFTNYNNNYNIPPQIDNKNIISLNNNKNQLNKIINVKKDSNPKPEIKNNNIKGLSTNIDQHNNQNIQINYNTPKLNINMTYIPKLQNNETANNNKQNQTIENKINETNNQKSNLATELKSLSNAKTSKKTNNKDNSSSNETKNINNNSKVENNNKNNTYKIEQNYNKNVNNNNNSNTNNKNSKCEKLFLNLDDIASGKDMRTTIMIRNIPIKYTESVLNDEFKEFHGKYDCLYMPYDYEKKGNKGYAFINFINPLHILLFYEKFTGKKWMHFESPKICELNMAHFQGVNEIQKHAKNYKELKKACFSKSNDKIVIPSKYLSKLKKRFPKMKYSENNKKNEFEILSFN